MNLSASLIDQILEIDPSYNAPALAGQAGFPHTIEGRNNYLAGLRADLAAATYNIRGDIGPLQTETLRFLQGRVDVRYREGERMFSSGELDVHLGRNEAIGNYMDGAVRRDLQAFYSRHGVSYGRGQQITGGCQKECVSRFL